MKRLAKQSNKNSPQEYDNIFIRRENEKVDEQDLHRWNLLLKHYKKGKLIDLGTLDSLVPSLAKIKSPESEIWGIDLSKVSIQRMSKKYPNIYYEVGNVYDTKFPSNYFDYATAGELIEHLEHPEKFFKEAYRILKVNGVLALSTPFEEEHDLGAVDHERHLWSFGVDDIVEMWKPYGTVKTKIIGSRWFPTYKYYFPSLIAYCFKK